MIGFGRPDKIEKKNALASDTLIPHRKIFQIKEILMEIDEIGIKISEITIKINQKG